MTALAAISLAGGCKSEQARSGQEQQASSPSTGEQASNPGAAQGRPAFPVPRRMRGSQPEAAADGDQASGDDRGDGRRERFAEMRKKFDADGDGQLNDQERAAMRHDALLNRLKQIDTDGDGKLSRQEMEQSRFAGRLFGDFDSMDKDKDSFVTLSELEASMAERRARWDAARPQGADRPAPPPAQ